MSMITAAQWVPRGFAAHEPKKYDLDEAEYDRIAALANLRLTDAEERLKEAEKTRESTNGDAEAEVEDKMSVEGDAADEGNEEEAENGPGISLDDDDLKEYDLEHYDDDDDDIQGHSTEGGGLGMFANMRSLAYYESNDDDPYITLKGGDGIEDDEDKDDLQILATDNLILSAKVEDELAHLEVYVFEDDGDNLYVHHDIMLPAIPLCLEWIDLPVGKKDAAAASTGNFVAVGTLDPDIEVWDLDLLDCMYPNAILGQGGDSKAGNGSKLSADQARRKKKWRSRKANDRYHVDAVLSLAANRKHRNLLASASADKTIKLWDLNTAECAKSYSYHTDKVCSLAWHTTEVTVLLSGSYDRTVAVADMRAPEAKIPRWGVESDVENVRWDPHDTNLFFASTEGGAVHCHDVRNAPKKPEATKSVWTLQAHDEAVSSFDINTVIPGLMATGSTDRTVKLWSIGPTGPSMVVSRNLDVGKVFATTFAPDAEVAFRLAVAGSSGSMHVWDTSTNASVRKLFAHRMAPGASDGETVEERLIGVNYDDNDDDDEEEEVVRGAAGSDGDSMDED